MSPCRPQMAAVFSKPRYARKPRHYHLDNLLHGRAPRPVRLRDSPLHHHLSFPEEPETKHAAGGAFRPVAQGDDATADLQRSLRGRAAAEIGERDRLSERPAPDPGAR